MKAQNATGGLQLKPVEDHSSEVKALSGRKQKNSENEETNIDDAWLTKQRRKVLNRYFLNNLS